VVLATLASSLPDSTHVLGARKPKQVLIVEDDTGLARSIKRVMTGDQLSAAVVSTCKQALALLEEFEIGVFDLQLPDGCGAELAQHLWERGTVERILFFTASTDPEVLERAQRLGVVISKRCGVAALMVTIADQLSNRA
jgi:DNA-binding response OmpR family regulator